MTTTATPKIGLVSSRGGHMKQMRLLKQCYEQFPHFLVTVKGQETIHTHNPEEKKYLMTNIGEGRWKKSPFGVLKSFWEVYQIYRSEKPDFVISTGCGIAVPAFMVAKAMGIRTIYVEPGARVYTLSKTGRICYRLSDLFFVQHRDLAQKYPKALYNGILYKQLGD